ncbi:hypothetical protein FMN50_08685 [Rhodobacterales bacterium]|nr:hypothetical protein FMN50_08685 [Rhodobacterales bacterium]
MPLAILSSDETAISLAVEGQVDLVDAFEMACSLGPHDCIVLEAESSTATPELFEHRNERMNQ